VANPNLLAIYRPEDHDVGVQTTPIDPRDQTTEWLEPAFRVYFWDGRASDEWQLRGADVPEVLDWAQRQAGSRSYTVWAAIPDVPQAGVCLVRLAGGEGYASATDRPPHAGDLYGPAATGRTQPAGDELLTGPIGGMVVAVPIGEGAMITTIESYADRFVLHLRTLSEVSPFHMLALWEWEVTDDVGTDYAWLGGGAGGGPSKDWMFGTVCWTPAPPKEARELRIFIPERSAELFSVTAVVPLP
jgi:hypothetical protein